MNIPEKLVENGQQRSDETQRESSIRGPRPPGQADEPEEHSRSQSEPDFQIGLQKNFGSPSPPQFEIAAIEVSRKAIEVPEPTFQIAFSKVVDGRPEVVLQVLGGEGKLFEGAADAGERQQKAT